MINSFHEMSQRPVYSRAAHTPPLCARIPPFLRVAYPTSLHRYTPVCTTVGWFTGRFLCLSIVLQCAFLAHLWTKKGFLQSGLRF